MNFDISKALETIQGWIDGLISFAPTIVMAILVFLLILFAGKGLRTVVVRLLKRHQRSPNVGVVVGRLLYGVIAIMAFFVAIMIIFPSVTPAGLISTLGLSSIAIGFAFKDILQNFFAGILILLTEPFHIGDQVRVDGYEGTVEHIETRATTIKTYDGLRVVIPNADMFTHSVTVNTAFELRRSEYDFGISYGDDIAKAKDVILTVLKKTEGVLQTPEPAVATVELADSSVLLKALWWTGSEIVDVLTARDAIITAVKEALDANEVSIPFPTRSLYIESNDQPSAP